MKITTETSLVNFQTWGGAIETQNTIIKNGKSEEFEALIDELYPEGLTDTQLNDLLWFDPEWIFEALGIREDEETED